MGRRQPDARHEHVRREVARPGASDSELRLIWKALPQSDYGTIVKLLTLTGQRLTEIADLRWSEVDFDANLIRLPRERSPRPYRGVALGQTDLLVGQVQVCSTYALVYRVNRPGAPPVPVQRHEHESSKDTAGNIEPYRLPGVCGVWAGFGGAAGLRFSGRVNSVSGG